jgi:DNA-binding transcriptional MerR regulator
MSDDALTITDLAERAGMTVRNLREWRTLGLLPRATMRGRVGYYEPEILDRVRRIQRLHAEGFTLDLIARMLDAGGDAADEVIRLAAALHAPYDIDAAAPGKPPKQRMEQIKASLDELGLTSEQISEATARIREHVEAIAEVFEQVWRDGIWEPFVDAGMPDAELPRIQATAARVKPLALEAVVAQFTLAMEAQIERGIARELDRAAARAPGA